MMNDEYLKIVYTGQTIHLSRVQVAEYSVMGKLREWLELETKLARWTYDCIRANRTIDLKHYDDHKLEELAFLSLVNQILSQEEKR